MNAIRDGKIVAPTCPECGCRLTKAGDGYLSHFFKDGEAKTDARGCKCKSLLKYWPINSVVKLGE